MLQAKFRITTTPEGATRPPRVGEGTIGEAIDKVIEPMTDYGDLVLFMQVLAEALEDLEGNVEECGIATHSSNSPDCAYTIKVAEITVE